MFAILKLTLILMLIHFVSGKSGKVKARFGPSGMSFDDTTNCSVFSKFGRFNPYSVLHEKWFVFFYWAHPIPLTTYIFTFPTANHTRHLKRILDGNTILPVMWSSRQILMEDHKNQTSLLVERGDRGEYWWYPLYKVNQPHKISPRDVRLKQTGDNRILGYMDCVDESLLVMSRINDVPPKNRLQEEASRLGFRGRRGKSYLYQGHEWLPIPEDDEKKYWSYNKPNTGTEESSKEAKSQEQDEDVNPQPTNEPDDSKKKKNNKADSQLKFNEEELETRCTRIDPELWNDPTKPEATYNAENRMITKEELKSLDTTVFDTTQYIEAPDSNKPENNLANELENKLDNHQDEPKPVEPFHEQKYHKSNNEIRGSTNQNLDITDENCAICFESSHYMQSTSEPYIPENTHSYTNLKNNEPSTATVAESKTPQDSNSSIQPVITLTPRAIEELES